MRSETYTIAFSSAKNPHGACSRCAMRREINNADDGKRSSATLLAPFFERTVFLRGIDQRGIELTKVVSTAAFFSWQV